MLCSKCHLDKEIENFSFKNSAKRIRTSICKNCHSEYRRGHYLKNKRKYIVKAQIWNKKQNEILTQYLFRILSDAQCVDCGENDIVVLEFDHLSNKRFSIAQMYKNNYSLAAIKTEISKCVVRCANCHRRRTAKQINSWRIRLTK